MEVCESAAAKAPPTEVTACAATPEGTAATAAAALGPVATEEAPPTEATAGAATPDGTAATAAAALGPVATEEVAAIALDSEEARRERRIREALARCEAPIKPEYLRDPADVGGDRRGAGAPPNKRPAPDEPAPAPASEQPPSKKRRGQNKAKDRTGNVAAMKAVRASQLCATFAYLNCCDGALKSDAAGDAAGKDAGGDDDASAAPGEGRGKAGGGKAGGKAGGKGGCKNPHDLEAFNATKLPPIADKCPVLERIGVCPAGLNCRFGGHVVNGKNVDREGVELSKTSAWAQKVPDIGHPVGETNAFEYSMIKQLRSRSYDFSRATDVVKIWNKYSSGASDTPGVGPIVDAERKPLDLAGKTVLAPLTTVGNLPFRRLCVKLGCDVTVGEMALAGTILEGGPGELALLRRHESEKCFGVQVAGGDVEVMTKIAQFVDEKVDCDFVDLNCGCPLDEVHRRGAGSRLMSRVKPLEGIVRCMANMLTTKHLTLKMRTAHFEDKDKTEFAGRNAHRLVPQIENWGVSAITLHGRTARQRYTKLADWDYINECSKRRVTRTPLVGCGDVLSWEEAEEHRRSHGVDAIMVARGALIKPWLFTEISERRHWDISASERFDLMRDFTNYGLEHWGADARGVETTRRFLLEWLSFSCRYVPAGLLEQMPQKINWRPRPYVGRSDLETKLGSSSAQDWVEITEMLLGKVPDGFSFTPKHKSNSYEQGSNGATGAASETVGEAG